MPDFELHNELEDALGRVAECVNDMYSLGVKKAEAERNYRVAKQKRILYERTHNATPVSIISDIVKGYEDIAELAMVRDCAETEYDANYEAILYWKKRVDTIREQIKREWSQAGETV